MIASNALKPIRSWFAPVTHLRGARKVLREFRPKVAYSMQRGDLLVKTAETVDELEEVLKLRHDVFHTELLGRRLPFGLEFDQYDAGADHLMVIDRRVDKVVGTYRLRASNFCKNFYSQSEFAMDEFLSAPGGKLELSRACIHPEHRDGMVIHLLWRGMVGYWSEIGASHLFGCASVKTTDREEIAFVCRYLKAKGYLRDDVRLEPLPDFRVEGLEQVLRTSVEPAGLDGAKALIPPLFLGYLRAGAKVCGLPALDRDFKCVDFLTVLKRDEISQPHQRRYTS